MIASIILSIIIGAFASFIVWFVPTECFNPKIKPVSCNQKEESETIINSKGESVTKQVLKRNVHIINESSMCAAYNITCFFEFFDDENNIVYHEEKQQAYTKANTKKDHSVVIPFKKLQIANVEQKKSLVRGGLMNIVSKRHR